MVDRENKNDPLRQDNKRPSDRDDRRRIETTRSGKTPAEDRARSSSEERSRRASGDASRRSGPRKSMEDEPRDVSGINPQRTAADTPPPVGNRPRSAAEDRPGRSSSGRNLGEQPPAPQGTTRRTERSAETGSSGRGSGSKRLRQDDREDWSGSSTGSSHRPGILSALFRDRESAEDAYQATLDRDYEPDEVNIVMSKETREQYFHDRSEGKSEMGNKALEGTGAGSAIGGGLGLPQVYWQPSEPVLRYRAWASSSLVRLQLVWLVLVQVVLPEASSVLWWERGFRKREQRPMSLVSMKVTSF